MPRAKMKRVRHRRPTDRVISREALGKEVGRILEDRQLTQTEAAYIVKDAPSQISLVVSGKLRGFSIERLLRMLARLGRDIDVVIRDRNGNGQGKVKVVVNR